MSMGKDNELYNRWILLILILVFLGLGASYLRNWLLSAVVSVFRIGTHEFRIEVASTWETQERGLGYRSDLCGDCGMLFVFATPGRYGFWMKGMEFPLDILWIRDSHVVSIEKNLPADDRRTFTPPSPADQVLEINAGLVDRYGISVGDSTERVR